jgi:PIN domain nuclease of toxin-antitoxin system
MKILLDTHTLIWYIQGNEKLGEKNKLIIENPENRKYFSIASIWEMALKINSGKLQISQPLQFFIPLEIELVSIKLDHIYQLERIPFLHKDPFDRLIISTSITENFFVMSIDENFEKYDINLIWNERVKTISNSST